MPDKKLEFMRRAIELAQQPFENQPIKSERIVELYEDALAAYLNSVVSPPK
jgi:hypothetical protein